MRKATFRRIFEEANKIGAHAIVAGGAVTNFRLASDVDVFVLQRSYRECKRSLAEDCDDLLKAFDGALVYDAARYVSADEGRGEFYRAGKAEPDWSPLPIHVIGWRSPKGQKYCTPIELLETFDLSVHAWAIDDTNRLIGCDNSTGPCEPIRICHDTPTTAERLVKLTRRYFPTRIADAA